MRKKFVFLILHYQSLEDTYKCVDSIEDKCGSGSNNDYSIVIVDNASPNQTGLKLENKFKNVKQIHVVLLNCNLGFANGNNAGINYIKKHFDFDYIIMINSDTEILSNDFLKIIDEQFSLYHYAVLGPKIIHKDGEVDRYPFNAMPLEIVKRQYRRFKIYKWLCKVYLHWLVAFILKKRNIIANNNDRTRTSFEVVLHGSALVFSRVYFEKFDGLYDKTFLYKEEQILFHRLVSNGLLSVYCPQVSIMHKEGGSTDSKNDRKKMINYLDRQLKSARILIKYFLEDYGN